MKICLISNNYPSEGNPTYIFVQQLVEALVDQGIFIDIIAPQSITNSIIRQQKLLPFTATYLTSKGNKYQVFRPKYISFGNIKILNGLASFLRNQSITKAVERIGANKIDVFYAHFWNNAYAIKKLIKKTKLPLFVACGEGDNALEELVASMSLDELKDFKQLVTGVISVSSENKRKCIHNCLCSENNVVVLPNCVNQSIFYKRNYSDCRKKLGLKQTDFTVIFVGGFIHRKGSVRLAQALSQLNNTDIKAIFIGRPMGSDSELPEYEQSIFQGPLSHDELPNYLCAADVFVLPTLKEGCCNAIVEAVACGLPIISSDLPFNYDVLDEQNSILIDPLNVDEIANAIKQMYDDPALRERMSLSSLSKAQNLKIETRAKRILDFILSKTTN